MANLLNVPRRENSASSPTPTATTTAHTGGLKAEFEAGVSHSAPESTARAERACKGRHPDDRSPRLVIAFRVAPRNALRQRDSG
ncbi:hypothetical protein V2W30_40165 (plasmid) [Streptomyces sp. Q6]|uniref:Uncharacterized protein n=1 Tax=Streptomyces citrinus TaxID=3118173 RepID=A0ACD5AQB5_9ACTN